MAQEPSERVCTDLSGKIRLACPKVGTPVSREALPGVQNNATRSATTGVTENPAPGVALGKSGNAVSSADDVDKSGPTHRHSLERSFARNLISDQKNILTSPLNLRLDDATWLFPLVGSMTAVTLADGSIERELPTNPTFIRRSKSFSDYGAAAFAGVVASGYVWGRVTNNDHLRETAILSGEAAINSLLITEGVKYIAGRQRPIEGDGTGSFRSGGASFPSLHSSGAWAIASVIAREYPGPLSVFLAYGGAAAISAARITGRQHFTSDALVGSAIGWYVGRQVFNAHSARENPDNVYGRFQRRPAEHGPFDPSKMGSPYLPLDSWVYDAIERLASLGYIDTAFAGIRPWTRLECARLVEEAGAKLESTQLNDSLAAQLYQSLHREFAVENRRLEGARNLGVEIESVYTRVTGISGEPLTDGFQFAQTLTNDYGRPYQQGFNFVTGFSSHAEAGPLTFYFRGEYQHSPSAPAWPLAARSTIAARDGLPLAPATDFAQINRFRLLDSYFGLKFSNWQMSIGKQTLWWGPGSSGPMMLSDNIEPINMIRLSRTSPVKLPSILGWLGPMRTESFFGQLAGEQFILSPNGLEGQYGHSLDSQPFLHGQKIAFKPSPNFEFGFSRTTIFGGAGYPLTTHSLFHSLFSTGNTLAGLTDKPGDRRSGLDFSYRLPKLRDWLTFYGDGFTEDEYSPIAYADRSVWHAGLFLARFPKIQKLDLRVEGVYSDNPVGGRGLPPGYFYANGTWRDGYRNEGNLIGNWIGRAGQGAQAWTTYHFSPRNDVQLNFRHQKVSWQFVPGGGTLTDFEARGKLWVRSQIEVSTSVQYERWAFPVLRTTPESNISSSIQITYRPPR